MKPQHVPFDLEVGEALLRAEVVRSRAAWRLYHGGEVVADAVWYGAGWGVRSRCVSFGAAEIESALLAQMPAAPTRAAWSCRWCGYRNRAESCPHCRSAEDYEGPTMNQFLAFVRAAISPEMGRASEWRRSGAAVRTVARRLPALTSDLSRDRRLGH